MQRNGYSKFQILLHWAVAILVLFNYVYSDGMGRALHARLTGEAGTAPGLNPQIHVWVGMAVLALVLLRMLVRRISGAPVAAGLGVFQRVATWGHLALYLLMLLVPLLGALTWFGRLDATADLHSILANLLMVAAGGHALIAIWHQFVVKDHLLIRMMKPGRE